MNGQDAGCLGGVHHKKNPVFSAELSDKVEIQYISCEIGRVGAHHRPGGGPYIFFKIIVVNVSLFICREDGQFHTPLLHEIQGAEHGVMLQRRCDHVVARREETLNGDIQRHGGIQSKGRPLRAVPVKEFAEHRSCRIETAHAGQGRLVGAPGCISQGEDGVLHRLRHLRGLMQGRGRVVKIYHNNHLVFLAASMR